MVMEGNFIPPNPLNTAVLFMLFNRIDTTKQVFEAIRLAKPPYLYIAADGARTAKEGEAEKVKAVRDYVMGNIDWTCEVKTLFRDKNLGCKYAVSSAITWFFENEEYGIILEDDCLPSPSFFWFCEELLEMYKDDMKIWQISGCNFQDGINRGVGDYYFSKYNLVWGWASWANRWKCYDVELDAIKDTKFLKRTFHNKRVVNYWSKVFWMMKKKKIDTWDYQWVFASLSNSGLTILPKVNMISNIGYGAEATHTKTDSEISDMQRFDLIIENHPNLIVQNIEADEYTFEKLYAPPSFFIRVINKIQRILKEVK